MTDEERAERVRQLAARRAASPARERAVAAGDDVEPPEPPTIEGPAAAEPPPRPRPRRRRPAAGARALALGSSAAATLGILAWLGATDRAAATEAPNEPSAGTTSATAPQRPRQIVVVVRRHVPAPPSSPAPAAVRTRSAPAATPPAARAAAPAQRRPSPAPPAARTHASR